MTGGAQDSGVERTPAQFFFECGYGAAYADAFMENGQKPAFTMSDAAIERAWAIAPEAHEDGEEWSRHMAATQQPPRHLIRGESGCTLEPIAGAQSDEAIRHLQTRSALNRAIYKALHDHRLSNMCDEEGYPWPLLDLMSNPAPSDISTGEYAMVALADEICEAVEAQLARATPAPAGWQDEPFGYFVEHKLAEPAFLRKPSYIPEGDNYTVTPLYVGSPVWQPIATAPKDDTLILVWRQTTYSDDPFVVVRWENDWWQVHDGKDDWDLRGPEPTHWMPLPTAPAEGGVS